MADGLNFHPTAADQKLVLSQAAPLDSAREFIWRHHTSQQLRTLHHQCGSFYVWHGSHYREAAEEEIRAASWQFLDTAFCQKDDKLAPFSPTKAKVANVLEAIAAEAQIPTHQVAPTWLDGRQAPPPGEVVSVKLV